MQIANFISPCIAEIIAQGIIAVPEPSIGRASTNAIPSAAINGKATFIPTKLNVESPIKHITKDININVTCAFKYPPSVFVKSFKCVPIETVHFLGK